MIINSIVADGRGEAAWLSWFQERGRDAAGAEGLYTGPGKTLTSQAMAWAFLSREKR
jgi:hypothetical protein